MVRPPLIGKLVAEMIRLDTRSGVSQLSAVSIANNGLLGQGIEWCVIFPTLYYTAALCSRATLLQQPSV
jgi:hypothetical protein